MKNSIIILCALLYSASAFSQIGINTPEPKATFDITAKNPIGSITTPEGWLTPRIDRQRAQSMTGIETSTLVYINSISTGTQTGTAINIDSLGYYYYDGKVWLKIVAGAGGDDTNIYNKDGILTTNRIVAQAARTISFTGTSLNAFSIHENTFSVDAFNHRTGVGTASPETPLDIKTENQQYGLQQTDGTIQLLSYVGANAANGNKQAGWMGTKSAHTVDIMTSDLTRVSIDETGKVGIGSPIPASSAILDVSSTNKGFIPPRLTSTQRDAIISPAAGLMIFNTDNKCMQNWNGTTWIGDCSLSVDCNGWKLPYSDNNGSATGTINGLNVNATFSEFKNVKKMAANATYYDVPTYAANGFTLGDGNISSSMKIKFNHKVNNIKVYQTAIQSGETMTYTLKNNGFIVSPVLTLSPTVGYSSGFTITGNQIKQHASTNGTGVIYNVGGDWFDEIVIQHNGTGNGSYFNFCIGNASDEPGPDPGTIATLDCAGATHIGSLEAGMNAIGVSSVIQYTGGNGGPYHGQTVTSTGVLGLTATLASGSFANGNGELTYIITGIPSSGGTASFAVNIGGQNCTLTRTVTIGTIATLDCAGAINTGDLKYGFAATGVSSVIPYTGGNGRGYLGQVINSTGVTGLTATLNPGSFANGNGTLTYTITGTPSSGGIASFSINIGGQACILTRTVTNTTPPPPDMNSNCTGWQLNAIGTLYGSINGTSISAVVTDIRSSTQGGAIGSLACVVPKFNYSYNMIWNRGDYSKMKMKFSRPVSNIKISIENLKKFGVFQVTAKRNGVIVKPKFTMVNSGCTLFQIIPSTGSVIVNSDHNSGSNISSGIFNIGEQWFDELEFTVTDRVVGGNPTVNQQGIRILACVNSVL